MILLNRVGKIRGEKEERGEGRKREGRKGGKVHSVIKVRVYMCEWVSEGG